MSQVTTTKHNSTEERALHLLGMGIAPEKVAATCGVTVSRISQLLSEEEFANKVGQLRFEALEKHNVIDNKYDKLEDKLLDQFEKVMPLMAMDPNKLLNAITRINGAKRRGVSAPDQITSQQTVVQLTIPSVIMQRFTTNINNQVIHAGEQTLQTIQSNTLADKFKSNTITPKELILSSSPLSPSTVQNTEENKNVQVSTISSEQLACS